MNFGCLTSSKIFSVLGSISKIKEAIMGSAPRVQGSIKPPQMQGKAGISALSITPPEKDCTFFSGSELSPAQSRSGELYRAQPEIIPKSGKK